MAKVKFSALVSEMRNKLNGSVFSKNRGGNYLRNKVTPVNPATSAQLLVRNIFTFLSQSWRTLTESQRAAWNSAVSNWTTTDIFADVRTPSGFNLYKKLNQNLGNAQQVFISDPPLPSTVDPNPIVSLAADDSAQTMTIDTFGSNPVPAGETLVLEATPNLSPGKNFVESEFAVIGLFPPATAFPLSIIAEFTAKYGPVVSGQKIFVRGKYILNATGQASQYSKVSTIVVP